MQLQLTVYNLQNNDSLNTLKILYYSEVRIIVHFIGITFLTLIFLKGESIVNILYVY